jgi:hypothetical protein
VVLAVSVGVFVVAGLRDGSAVMFVPVAGVGDCGSGAGLVVAEPAAVGGVLGGIGGG